MSKNIVERRGLVFSTDIIIGVSILFIVLFSSFYLFSSPETHREKLYDRTNLISNDFLNSLSELKVYEASNLSPTINSLIQNDSLTEDEQETSTFNLILTLWAQGEDEGNETKKELAKNITYELINSTGNYSGNFNLSIVVSNFTIYGNYSSLPEGENLAVSTMVESTYNPEKPKYGYISRAYLSEISREGKSYLYFGGFVGQGDISSNLKIPLDASIKSAYLEVYSGADFNLYINGNLSGSFSPTTFGNFSANIKSYDINISNLKTGNNSIEIDFTSGNNTEHFIGGGFLRVTYETSNFYEMTETGNRRYHFPGIEGLINLYDAFYVPGDLNNMSAYLHYYNNVTGAIIYMTIGNSTVYASNATGEQTITLNSSQILSNLTAAGLSYSDLSKNTIPIKIGTSSLMLENGYGASDAVLITDVSGSMTNCDVESNCTAGICDTSDPCHRERINVAKDVDKDFVDNMLNVSGNRVGLVSFDSSVDDFHELSTDNIGLKNHIDTYGASGSTCICCGINKARNLSEEPYYMTLISEKSIWKYNINYPYLEPPEIDGFNWTAVDYNDTSWSSGQAILGFSNITWDYRKEINISNTAGDLTNYSIGIKLNLSDEYSNNKIQQYCEDARFTYYNSTSGNETEISYWVEECNLSAADNATFWVKLPFIENNANTTVYFYYGNPSADSASDGNAVFEFFDDFEEAGLNTSKWTNIANAQVYAGSFKGNGGDRMIWANTVETFDQPLEVTFLMRSEILGDFDSGVRIGNIYYISDHGTGSPQIRGGWWVYPGGSQETGIWHRYSARVTGPSSQQFIDWTADKSDTAGYSYSSGSIYLVGDSDSSFRDTFYDWVFVREYASPEPAIDSVGSEELVSKNFSSELETDIGNNGGNYFFRKVFYFPQGNLVNKSYLYVLSDDNAEVYLNGHLIDNDTAEHNATYWNRDNITSINSSYFRAGNNVIAVKLRNDDNIAAEFDLKLEVKLNRKRAMLVMSDGSPNRCCDDFDSYSGNSCGVNSASNDAIESSCYARDQGILVYSVAFGNGANEEVLQKIACWNCSANDWIEGEEGDNCSRYFQSSNEDELKKIYMQIAQEIANLSFEKQIMRGVGNITFTDNILYNDSYLKFNYNETSTDFNFGEFSLMLEENFTSWGKVVLNKPSSTELIEAKLTSYSGDYWSSLVIVNNSKGNYTSYNLSEFGDYTRLGDPFTIYLPKEQIANGTNNITLRVGLGESNQTLGSNDSKLIYKLKIPGYVGYGDTFNTSESAKEDAIQRLIDKVYNLTGINISDWNITKPTEPIRGVQSVYSPGLIKVIVWKE